MWVGGPPKPTQPIRPHSRRTTRSDGGALRLLHGPIFAVAEPGNLRAMGEEQRLPPAEQLAAAREAFEAGTDFTVAVEEEFALLDPDTLTLVNRFEDVQAAAKGTDARAAPRRRADRVRGGGAHRQVRRLRRGRRDDGRAARPAPGARARARAPARRAPARIRGRAGRTSGSSTRRTTGGTTSSSATSSGATTPSACTSTSASAAPTAPSRVCNALRNFLPELLALSASSPFVEDVNSGLHSARTEIFTRMFPRCGIPDAYDGWRGFEEYVAFLYRDAARSPSTRSSGGACGRTSRYPTVEIRICDAQPDLAESQSLAALDVRARRALRAGARRGRAAAGPAEPPARGEPLARDPLRAAGRADRLRPRRDGPGARAARAARRVGRARRRGDRRGAVPGRPGGERGRAAARALRAEGATLREIYAEQVGAGERIG